MKKYIRVFFLIVAIALLTLTGVIMASFVKSVNKTVYAETIYVPQEINKAMFENQQEFPIRAEQPEDTPLRILDARVDVISSDNYQQLTGERAAFPEVITKPKVLLQNVSNKNIVGIVIMTVDKAAGTKFGLYIRKQMIRPGQKFTVVPENFEPASENPAKNPGFWMQVRDKSQIVVRVVAFFEDGSLWGKN